MCGIWGMLQYRNNGFDYSAKEAITPLMLLTSMRGAHSTGMFGVEVKKDGTDKLSFVKKVGSPYNLLLESDTKKFIERAFRDFHAVIGHGRFATKGEITAENAHPFHEDNIVLVHNGGINNLHEFKYEGAKVEDLVDVDSHACALLLNTMDPKEFFQKIRGAFAFIWYDRRTKNLYACRNDQRPMYIIVREDVPGIIFSSEQPTLDYIKAKHNMKASEPLDITPEYLYTFPLGATEKVNYSREKIKFHVWSSYTGGTHSRRNRGADWDNYSDAYWNRGEMTGGYYTRSRDAYTPLTPSTMPVGVTAESHEFDHVRKMWVPKSVATKASEPRIKKADLDNYTFRKDDYIAWWPTETELINKTEKDEKEQFFVVHGLTVPSERVSICYHAKGREHSDVVHRQLITAGKIQSIYYLKEGEGRDNCIMRLYVKDLVMLSDSQQDELGKQGQKKDFQEMIKSTMEAHSLNDAMMFLKLKNGDQISLHRYNTLAKRGCARCGHAIDVTDAVGVLNVSDVNGATDRELKHGGFYCTDCVLRSVSH